MKRRIFGVETEYALGVETADGRLRAFDPGMLFDHLEVLLQARYKTLEADSFGRNPGTGDDHAGIGIREGRFLESGARFYYDTGHLEWATPESTTAVRAVIYELAGERTLAELADEVDVPDGARLMLLKNNVDYVRGRTFGCHENYLVPRRTPTADDGMFFNSLVEHLVPFLVTRQIFTGAGRIGAAEPTVGVGFQLSQRADFIERVTSNETRSDRAIINLRDESLSHDDRYRRLHLILGDSNRSPTANFLKLGTTGLVLRLIEEGAPSRAPVLAAPVEAVRAVSRDPSCSRRLLLADGGRKTAVEIQRHYLEAAKRHLSNSDGGGETEEILELWSTVLDDLATDPERVADRVDWMIKRRHLLDPVLARDSTDWRRVGAWERILQALDADAPGGRSGLVQPSVEQRGRWQFLMDENGLDWDDLELQRSLYYELRERDLRYHDIDPDRGLFTLLDRAGLIAREHGGRELADASEISAAQREPPGDTRALLRAEVIRWAHESGSSHSTLLDWGSVALPAPRGALTLDDPFQSVAPELGAFLGASPGVEAAAEEDGIPIRILRVEDLPRSGSEARATKKSWFERLFGSS